MIYYDVLNAAIDRLVKLKQVTALAHYNYTMYIDEEKIKEIVKDVVHELQVAIGEYKL